MEHLARKISRTKWEPRQDTGDEDIRADAITGPCLRTYDDSLSLWKCKDDKTDIAEVVLALVTRVKKPVDKIETIHLLLLHKNDLETHVFTLEPTPKSADTHVEDLRARHIDVVYLTMTKICSIARLFAAKVRQNSGFYVFTRKQVLDIICDAVRADRLNLNALQDKARAEVEKRLK